VLGHNLLILPLYTVFAIAALIDPRVVELLFSMSSLGALQRAWFLIRDTLPGLLAASEAFFGRVLDELGVALMLGGDIRYRTRVLTTAVAHETMLGNWDTAIQLGVMLLTLSLPQTPPYTPSAQVQGMIKALELGKR